MFIISMHYIAFAGHEVLSDYQLADDDLQNHNIAIIQYDSRPLSSYWNTSIRWNKAFSDKFGHDYMYLSSHHNRCRYYSNDVNGLNDEYTDLANPWCKVKAMIVAHNIMSRNKDAKALLFLDSDALITVNYSMATVIGIYLYMHACMLYV